MTTYLVDTNVLLRWITTVDPLHIVSRDAVRRIVSANDRLCLGSQNLVEFWCAATRPVSANGLGMSPGQVAVEVAQVEAMFPMLPDNVGIHALWRQLVSKHAVSGRQVYDARLVALMLTHGVTHVLTFNVDDFRRYDGITVISPQDLSAVAPA